MGVSIGAQGEGFLAAAGLGMALALVYDLLRAIRMRRRRSRTLTAALDAVYWVIAAAGLAGFSLGFAGGELRLYMLAALGLGGAIYWAAAARVLRPLWDFWAEVLARPFRWGRRLYGKLAKVCKRGFLFCRRRSIIKAYERSARRAGRNHSGRGGMRHGRAAAAGEAGQGGEAAREPADDARHPGAAGAGGGGDPPSAR